ncbi:serpin A9 isoform X1 [Ochotona princeps]|uniref:serpin A9 isoform X1 n=1 Tax=Ochotona princeps TaxID=9978 RepID=UPI0027144C96|nr:serpin A9 isoform X1 [Ochotona princeps]
MAPSLYRVLLIVGLCVATCCVPPSSSPGGGCPHSSSVKNSLASQVTSGNTNFAFRLYRRLAVQTPGRNVIFSPVSVSTSLAMLSLGARSATKTQVLQSLGFNLSLISESAIHQAFQHLIHSLNVSSSNLGLKMGSVLFLREELQLQASFVASVRRLYKSNVFSIDFSDTATAQQRINSYVKKETKGKVVDMIHSLDPLTTMVLVNHIFFKAKWTKPFNPTVTNMSFPFLVGDKVPIHVPMMHQLETFGFGMDPELNCSVLQMHYKGEAMALLILPAKGKMKQLELALSASWLRKWSRSLQERWIEVFIPKVSISASYDLETILPKMGIHNAFDKNADFSGITKRHSLHVSKAAHKAVLDISEEGTEAVAATVAKFTVRSKDGSSHHVLYLDRPFLFLVINKATDAILFLGKVENPTQA